MRTSLRGLLLPSSERRHEIRAFTLIELLVVLGVLAILAVLHAAAIPRAKSLTETAGCLSNLRRLGLAWLMYAADHGGAVPGNSDGAAAPTNQNWCGGWLDFSASPQNTNFALLMQAQLGKYAQTPAIYHCPADRSLSRGTTGLPRIRSISMNGYVGNPLSPGRPYTSGYRNFKMIDDFTDPAPARAFVFIDEREDSINDGWFASSMTGYFPPRPRQLHDRRLSGRLA
jgi:prepilin-type N-terminal cleavage/methylation domain-containing protein